MGFIPDPSKFANPKNFETNLKSRAKARGLDPDGQEVKNVLRLKEMIAAFHVVIIHMMDGEVSEAVKAKKAAEDMISQLDPKNNVDDNMIIQTLLMALAGVVSPDQLTNGEGIEFL